MRAPLPLSWSLPTTLKRGQLQNIAILIGAPLTGTKPQLLENIQEAATTTHQAIRHDASSTRESEKSVRVLSIDMGIRNLAFAFLSYRTRQLSSGMPIFEKPTLHEWRRVGLMSIKHSSQSQSGRTALQLPNVASDEPEKAMTAESFEPNVMAGHAFTFAKYCTSLKPTHILIERQRFRSGGHSAVQEWSLRVGMLEAMLYATFKTLSAENILVDTIIEPMLPMRVNKYWFQNQDIPATGKQAKLAKIALVSNMLQALSTKHATFAADEDVTDVVGTFGSKPSKNCAADRAAKHSSKLDDMSDALLQGLAWINWQQNRVKLVTEGPGALGV